jgi:hypothetical protein
VRFLLVWIELKSPAKNDRSSPTPGNTMREVELTDGWYTIRGRLDSSLGRQLTRGFISIGDKLRITGAELGGSSEACTPLENDGVFLSLYVDVNHPPSIFCSDLFL